MPGFFDHLLAVALVLVVPLLAQLFWYPRLKRLLAANLPGARVAAYRHTIISQWLLLAAAVLLWLRAGRAFAPLGLEAPGGWRFGVGLAIVLAAAVFLHWQLRKVQQDPAARQQARLQLKPLEPLLPHSRQELRNFLPLAVTAGFCEEVLYRGFLIWYLAGFLGLWGGVVASSVFFGLAHLYQGARSAPRAGAVGLVFAGLYVFTGSLWVPMLLHAAIDVNGGQVAFTALHAEAASNSSASLRSPRPGQE
ncbi:MAG: CPBP family intramembrane glutamic endopeptidase [Candidatus Acidoferrales bacterium]